MQKTGTTFVLVAPDGAVLVQKRDDGRGRTIPYPNRWCFPGGSLEEGETYLENALREAHEEFGVVLDPAECHLVTTYDHDDITDDHVFICSLGKQKPTLGEGSAFKLIPFAEAVALPLAWEQERIVPTLEKALKTQHYL